MHECKCRINNNFFTNNPLSVRGTLLKAISATRQTKNTERQREKERMDAKKLQFFRELLQTKIAELSGDQQKTLSEMTATYEHHADITDLASFETDRNFELRIRDRERKLIAKMHESLQKIDDGTYGICQSCDEDISEKRLIARPVTTLCIKCKTEQEKIEKLKGGWGGQTMRFNTSESPFIHQEDFS
jgi:DnaK suppressor protein